jgi:hypothetical protein
MLKIIAQSSRRFFLFGWLALALAAVAPEANAQEISVDAIKRKISLANDLFVLNERIVTEVGMLRLGIQTEEARALLQTAVDDMQDYIDLLHYGDEGTERERSVAVQLMLTELETLWATYGQDVQAALDAPEISDELLGGLIEDNYAFSAQSKELVGTIYEVYGGTIFSPEETRALTLLAKERTRLEELREYMVLAAMGFRTDRAMAKLAEHSGTFAPSLDALIRNGAMYGIAPPPSPEAIAALEEAEALWADCNELIQAALARSGAAPEEAAAFWQKCEELVALLEKAEAAYNDALPRDS